MKPESLRIMQFNIEYGGGGVDFSSVAKAVNAAAADVVAVQEGCGQMQRVAADLGWPFFDVRTQVVSRYPLLNPGSGDGEPIYVELAPGRVVAVINVHPPSRGYGPTRLAKGVAPEKVMRREHRVRVSALTHSIRHARRMVEQEVPVVLLGDFNTPSHRDWTDSTVGLRDHLTRPFGWPTSMAVEEAGLDDVYRRHYPDPGAAQGLTWPADRAFVRGYNPAKAGQAADRIDLMYASRSAKSTSVRIVGEPASEFTDIPIEPWPSDHRALVASFELEAGPCPTILTSARALNRVGDEVQLRLYSPDGPVGSVVAVPSGSGREVVVVDAVDSLSWSGDFPASLLGPGQFDLRLLSPDKNELAETTIWVAEPGARPTLIVGKSSYQVGEGVDVTWADAPGNRADWVAVFDRGADPAQSRRKVWTYTGATVSGKHLLDGSLQPRRWPLPPGDYTVHLLLDDVWDSLAHADFSVVAD